MDVGFDHVTVAVTDLEEAKRFFFLLGFEESKDVVVSGPVMSGYMGIPDWKAEHVTLRHKFASSHQEVQLLKFHHPEISIDGETGNLGRTGFNHICFRVNDMDGQLAVLRANGFTTREGGPMDFHDRRLVFLEGPEGIVVELAEWKVDPAADQ